MKTYLSDYKFKPIKPTKYKKFKLYERDTNRQKRGKDDEISVTKRT